MTITKILIPTLAAAVLAVTLRKDKSDNTPIDTSGSSSTPDSGQGLTIGQVLRLAEQNKRERVNYRRLWAIAWHDMLARFGAEQALNELWQAWNIPENAFLSIAPNKEALLILVTQYIPDRALDLFDDKANIGQVSPVRWDDLPKYEDLYCIFNCSNDYWTCSDWRAWHRALDNHFQSTSKANDIWLAAWQAPENQCLFLSIMVCPDSDFCRVDCDFVSYFYSKGITIGNLASNIFCDLSQVVLDITETASNVTGTLGNVSAGAEQVSGIFKTIAPLAVLGVGAWWLFSKA